MRFCCGGEIEESINSSTQYLETVQQKVAEFRASGQRPEMLHRIDIESCGKSRIPLNGLVQDLHAANVRTLYQQMSSRN